MSKVNESIFSHKDVVIPMADVQHIEKKYHDCDLASGQKKGDLMGASVVTKHTRWDMDADCWANNIWLNADQTEQFMRAWCTYRHELEADTLALPEDMHGFEGTRQQLEAL